MFHFPHKSSQNKRRIVHIKKDSYIIKPFNRLVTTAILKQKTGIKRRITRKILLDNKTNIYISKTE